MKSDNAKKGIERAPHRSLFYAMGYTKEELAEQRRTASIKTHTLVKLVIRDKYEK